MSDLFDLADSGAKFSIDEIENYFAAVRNSEGLFELLNNGDGTYSIGLTSDASGGGTSFSVMRDSDEIVNPENPDYYKPKILSGFVVNAAISQMIAKKLNTQAVKNVAEILALANGTLFFVDNDIKFSTSEFNSLDEKIKPIIANPTLELISRLSKNYKTNLGYSIHKIILSEDKPILNKILADINSRFEISLSDTNSVNNPAATSQGLLTSAEMLAGTELPKYVIAYEQESRSEGLSWNASWIEFSLENSEIVVGEIKNTRILSSAIALDFATWFVKKDDGTFYDASSSYDVQEIYWSYLRINVGVYRRNNDGTFIKS